jgi:hypothetical protein
MSTTIKQVIAHLDKTIRDLMLERDALASLVPDNELVQRGGKFPTLAEIKGTSKQRRGKP